MKVRQLPTRAPVRDSIDLNRPSARLASRPQAIETAFDLNSRAQLNFDGDPTRLSWNELQAALANPAVTADARRNLAWVAEEFYDTAGAQAQAGATDGTDTGVLAGMQTLESATGATIRAYPGSEHPIARLEKLLAGLSKDPEFARVIHRLTVIIGPRGQGLDAMFGPEYSKSQGFADDKGMPGAVHGPMLAIRYDALDRELLTAAHELSHLVRADRGKPAAEALQRVWHQMQFRVGQPGNYPNPEEMFAYFGQWYLAGFGDVLKEKAPPLYELCEKFLGKARVDAEQATRATAASVIDQNLVWFRSGKTDDGQS
jgi:hypothetical protein